MSAPSRLEAADPLARAAAAAAAGHDDRRDPAREAALRDLAADDPDARVRAAALGALVRAARRHVALGAWREATHDSVGSVRRRAAELAPALGRRVPARRLVELLGDPDGSVAEAAAWALGEHPAPGVRAVRTLARAAMTHADPLVRESAVAALGAVGDPSGLGAVLAGCEDRPAVRRRAVLALAAFDGEEVEAALRRALDDRDWQVRQAAADLLGGGVEERGR